MEKHRLRTDDELKYSWKKKTSFTPRELGARFDQTIVATRDSNLFILFAGVVEGWTQKNDLWYFNLEKEEWKEIELKQEKNDPNIPPPMKDHTAVLDKETNTMYIFGGQSAGKSLNGLWIFDLDKSKWEYLTPDDSFPSKRFGHTVVLRGKQMIVYGGYYKKEDGTEVHLGDIWSFHLATRKWEQFEVNGEQPDTRYYQTTVLHKNQIIMYAGYRNGLPLGDFWTFNLDTLSWTKLDQPPLRARSGHIADIIGDEMFVFSGEGFDNKLFFSDSELWIYHIGRKVWRQVEFNSNELPSGRMGGRGLSVARGSNEILLVNGGVHVAGPQWKIQKWLNDVWMLVREDQL